MNIRKFRVEPISDKYPYVRISLDDMPISCREYEIEHYADSIPKVKIAINAEVQIEENAIVGISNLKEIAFSMDEEIFSQFCQLWKELHENQL